MEYTIEIVPNQVTEAPLKSHLYHSDKSKLFFQFDEMKVHYDGDAYDYCNNKNDVKTKNIATLQHDVEINEYTQTFFSPYFKEMMKTRGGEDTSKKDDKGSKGKEEKIDLKIVISTEINGRTIAQTSEKIPPPPRVPQNKLFES